MIEAPRPQKIAHSITVHGDTRDDPYFWLRQKENPEVIRHLASENDYCNAFMKPYERLKDELFEEMKARIVQDDQSVPVVKKPYEYFSKIKEGQQYWVYCRRKIGSKKTEILLDPNAMVEPGKYLKLGVCEISPNHKWLAYSVDTDGSERFRLRFKYVGAGSSAQNRAAQRIHALMESAEILETSPSLEWANDSKSVYFVELDRELRPYRAKHYRLGDKPNKVKVLYQEKDPQFFVSLQKSKDDRLLLIETNGSITTETHFLDLKKKNSRLRCVSKRRRGVEMTMAHWKGKLLIHTNDDARNFKILEMPFDSNSMRKFPLKNFKGLKEFVPHDPQVYIEDFDVFEGYAALFLVRRGLDVIRILPDTRQKSAPFEVAQDEPAYTLTAMGNIDPRSHVLRFVYASPTTPPTTFDYDLKTRKRKLLKEQKVLGGFDKKNYVCERVFVPSHDGVEVPLTLVYRKGFEKNGKAPFHLYGYGSYGNSMPPGFSSARLSLLDRGFGYAIAHVRGGSDLGRDWYQDGKFLKKKNTFLDFIACAEYLVAKKFTQSQKLMISGGSAGGLLVGAVLNLRPDLFGAAIAQVPFVDVLNTMLDDTLPLTPIEYEEWGNPKDPEYYRYMKSYSPYDNVVRQNYPPLLITAGLNDPRVTYWEPAKWCAKLRELKSDSNPVLLHINMGAGHGGASGRFDALKDIALEYAFGISMLTKASFNKG